MDIQRFRRGMTRGRIILLAMALLIVAQCILISIGISYTNSIRDSIKAQKTDVVLAQSAQTLTQRLSDINNLLLLLQMPDFSLFTSNYLSLRDKSVTDMEEKRLLNMLEALHISPDVISSIYMVGENSNQISIRKSSDNQFLEVLPSLRKDMLQKIGLEELLMRNHDQFIRYHKKDFLDVYNQNKSKLQPNEQDEIDSFLNSLDDHIVIATGTDKVLTIIALNNKSFEQAFPSGPSGQMVFSIVRSDSKLLWSSTSTQSLYNSISVGNKKTITASGVYSNSSRTIQPFGIRVVLSSLQPQNIFNESDLIVKMLVVSVGTLLIAFLFSFFYLRSVFRPFRLISQKIGNRHESADNTPVFRTIPEKLVGSRFHSIPLRNKLAILFCMALGILISTNGFLFSELMMGKIDSLITDSATVIGECSAISISDQVDFYKSLANQISTSRQLQDYLIDNKTNEYNLIVPLKMFPGLNKISYIVLFNKSGGSIYSSVYSNNNKVFDIASMQLKDIDEPYWIYNYNDILGQTVVALFRKINVENMDQSVWLMIVPKEEAFQIADTEQISARYSIRNSANATIYSNDTSSQLGGAEGVYEHRLSGDSGWTLSIRYTFSEISAMKQAFRERFLLSIFIVFLLCIGLSIMISSILTKPITGLTEVMQIAESNGVAKLLTYEKRDEIGGIIHSYNRMIIQLEDATRENLHIMEENAKNKIRENELLAMKTRAEMNMLQAQINPHFLYNTLTTINMQSIRHGDDDTSRIVNALAELLRYSISTNSNTVTLDQEIKHASNYITIQQIRFSNCFHASFTVPDELRSLPVLRFILQPIIENSIKHGFEGWEAGGEISVTACMNGANLIVRICDNGVGMDMDTLSSLRSEMEYDLANWQAGSYGIGLKNVYYRLQLKYHERMKMEIQSELMKGTEVMIEFPVL
jgi:two-component system, sensor histidine kinase YesM